MEEVPTHIAGYKITARDSVAKFNLFNVAVIVVDDKKFNNPYVWTVGLCVMRWKSFD